VPPSVGTGAGAGKTGFHVQRQRAEGKIDAAARALQQETTP
jgi:hypothetical protein